MEDNQRRQRQLPRSSDGRPMAESDNQRTLLSYAVDRLRHHFRNRDDAYVSGNRLFYYEEEKPGDQGRSGRVRHTRRAQQRPPVICCGRGLELVAERVLAAAGRRSWGRHAGAGELGVESEVAADERGATPSRSGDRGKTCRTSRKTDTVRAATGAARTAESRSRACARGRNPPRGKGEGNGTGAVVAAGARRRFRSERVNRYVPSTCGSSHTTPIRLACCGAHWRAGSSINSSDKEAYDELQHERDSKRSAPTEPGGVLPIVLPPHPSVPIH